MRRTVSLAIKRLIDIVVSMTALTLLSPVIAWTALAIVVKDGWPILFRQERPGRHERPFVMLKFRTMRATRPGEARWRTGGARVTGLGRFLRATSIDELPEFWNVLRGDMSVVGPRPLLNEYLAVYTPDELRRHEMPPGITGWAAVNGRHTLPFEERLRLDTWYVDHWSLALDVRIMVMTALQVLRRSDVATVQDSNAIALSRRFADALDRGAAAEGAVPVDSCRDAADPA
jgi:sugar transferase EpsL